MAALRTRKPSFMDELMAEHIRLPGAPQVIVTRAWAYQWLCALGYAPVGGFASVEYMVFGPRQRARDEPLTDLTQPHITALITLMEQHAQGD